MTKEHHVSDDREIRRIVKLLERSRFRDYDDVAKWRNELQANVRSLVARRMAPALNEKLAELPHATLAEKQTLCRWLNEELYSSGLAIRCPKTGQPALVHGDPGGGEGGRFQLELMGKDSGHKRTVSSVRLFPIEIMDHPIRPETVQGYWLRRTIEARKFGEHNKRS